MRRSSLAFLSLISFAACGPRYRHETLGTGTAVVGASLDGGAVGASPGAGGVTVSAAGQHRIDWRVQVPHAMKLAWALDCGGAQATGVAGESFEAYRDRRIAEIRAQREEEKKAIAALGGAVLGQATATADVQTPQGQGTAQVGVDGQAVGAAVADEVVSDDVQLPTGDVGPGYYGGSVTVAALAPGACTMRLAPEIETDDIAGVVAQFQVTRIVDIRAERDAARASARAAAIVVRGDLSARLIASGADPELRARQQAEARARAEAEAAAQYEIDLRLQAEAAARAEAELQVRHQTEMTAQAELDAQLRIEAEARAQIAGGAWTVRQSYLMYLVGVCGADPDHRAKEAAASAEAEARARAELEARGQLAFEARVRVTGTLIGYGADPGWRARQAEARALEEARAQSRLDAELQMEADYQAELSRRYSVALDVRAQVIGYLMMLGAIERPPMPEPMPEDPGDMPMDGGVWVAGEWTWQDAQWVWITGGWTFPDDGFSASVEVANEVRATVVDHRDEPSTTVRAPEPVRETVRDHRDEPAPAPTPPPERPKVRDHRDDKDDKKDDERPKVRDHRH
jgi:hypothetical protein